MKCGVHLEEQRSRADGVSITQAGRHRVVVQASHKAQVSSCYNKPAIAGNSSPDIPHMHKLDLRSGCRMGLSRIVLRVVRQRQLDAVTSTEWALQRENAFKRSSARSQGRPLMPLCTGIPGPPPCNSLFMQAAAEIACEAPTRPQRRQCSPMPHESRSHHSRFTVPLRRGGPEAAGHAGEGLSSSSARHLLSAARAVLELCFCSTPAIRPRRDLPSRPLCARFCSFRPCISAPHSSSSSASGARIFSMADLIMPASADDGLRSSAVVNAAMASST